MNIQAIYELIWSFAMKTWIKTPENFIDYYKLLSCEREWINIINEHLSLWYTVEGAVLAQRNWAKINHDAIMLEVSFDT